MGSLFKFRVTEGEVSLVVKAGSFMSCPLICSVDVGLEGEGRGRGFGFE